MEDSFAAAGQDDEHGHDISPRKRRAAAVAAQKIWTEMLSHEYDDIEELKTDSNDSCQDHFVGLETVKSSLKTGQKLPQKSGQKSDDGLDHIDISEDNQNQENVPKKGGRRKRSLKGHQDDDDSDYDPTLEPKDKTKRRKGCDDDSEDECYLSDDSSGEVKVQLIKPILTSQRKRLVCGNIEKELQAKRQLIKSIELHYNNLENVILSKESQEEFIIDFDKKEQILVNSMEPTGSLDMEVFNGKQIENNEKRDDNNELKENSNEFANKLIKSELELTCENEDNNQSEMVCEDEQLSCTQQACFDQQFKQFNFYAKTIYLAHKNDTPIKYLPESQVKQPLGISTKVYVKQFFNPANQNLVFTQNGQMKNLVVTPIRNVTPTQNTLPQIVISAQNIPTQNITPQFVHLQNVSLQNSPQASVPLQTGVQLQNTFQPVVTLKNAVHTSVPPQTGVPMQTTVSLQTVPLQTVVSQDSPQEPIIEDEPQVSYIRVNPLTTATGNATAAHSSTQIQRPIILSAPNLTNLLNRPSMLSVNSITRPTVTGLRFQRPIFHGSRPMNYSNRNSVSSLTSGLFNTLDGTLFVPVGGVPATGNTQVLVQNNPIQAITTTTTTTTTTTSSTPKIDLTKTPNVQSFTQPELFDTNESSSKVNEQPSRVTPKVSVNYKISATQSTPRFVTPININNQRPRVQGQFIRLTTPTPVPRGGIPMFDLTQDLTKKGLRMNTIVTTQSVGRPSIGTISYQNSTIPIATILPRQTTPLIRATHTIPVIRTTQLTPITKTTSQVIQTQNQTIQSHMVQNQIQQKPVQSKTPNYDTIKILETAMAKNNQFYDHIYIEQYAESEAIRNDCLAVIKGGNQVKFSDPQTLLSIKPLPFSWPSSIHDIVKSITKLDQTLTKERFKDCPVEWMIKTQLLKPIICKKCNSQNGDVVKKSRAKDFWKCNSCQWISPIENPAIFNSLAFNKISLSQLLFAIYYWSTKVDVQDLIRTNQINLDSHSLCCIWRKLQLVCTKTMETKTTKLGAARGPLRNVELATVQVGRFYVVGCMESSSPRFRLGVICCPQHEYGTDNGSIKPFLQFIQTWIQPSSNIIVCEPKFKALKEFGYDVHILSRTHFLNHLKISNIGGYMIQHLQKLFGTTDLKGLTHDNLTLTLEELQWRERFGKDPFNAFHNIIKHLAEQCAQQQLLNDTGMLNTLQTRNKFDRQQSITSSSSSSSQEGRISARQKFSGAQVWVDEYYYSNLKLNKNKKNAINDEREAESSRSSQFQCHLCQMFFDNILIVQHILEHIERERKGRVRKGDDNEIECKHCFRMFDEPIMPMHEELIKMEVVKFSCRICQVPYSNRNDFITHMRQSHFANEMPYYCDVCSYRSSFQKQLNEHFSDEHLGTESILCPFCLKIISAEKKSSKISQALYMHLASHYAFASVFECDKCVLTFVSEKDLRNHAFKGHNPFPKFKENFEIVPYVVPQEGKTKLCKAYEDELFTPHLPDQLTYSNTMNQETLTNSLTFIESTPDLPEDLDIDFAMEPEINLKCYESADSQPENSKAHVKRSEGRMKIEVHELVNEISNLEEIQIELPDFTDITYSNDFLELLMKLNFSTEEAPFGQTVVLYNGNRIRCSECGEVVTVDHYMKLAPCGACNYVTHCKKAIGEHIIQMHASSKSSGGSFKNSSKLNSSKKLRENNSIQCNDCEFKTKIGNQMSRHLVTFCHSSCSLSKY